MAVEKSRLAKPEGLDQIGVMARLELDVDQVWRRTADLDHLVGGGSQGSGFRVDHVDRPGRADSKSRQARGRIIPDQFFRRYVEAVELHAICLRRDEAPVMHAGAGWESPAARVRLLIKSESASQANRAK
jgi:hypothetical protein